MVRCCCGCAIDCVWTVCGLCVYRGLTLYFSAVTPLYPTLPTLLSLYPLYPTLLPHRPVN
jgi:hypothetical protein